MDSKLGGLLRTTQTTYDPLIGGTFPSMSYIPHTHGANAQYPLKHTYTYLYLAFI